MHLRPLGHATAPNVTRGHAPVGNRRPSISHVQPWPAAAYDGNFGARSARAEPGREGGTVTAVRRVRDLARAALPRSVGERLPAAPPQEVTELLHDKRFQRAVAAAADEQGRAEEEVWSEVKGYLHEMAAAHDDRTAQGWARLGDWFLRAYDVLVDEDDMQELRRLDRSHSLALAFSHRSYLDGMVIPNALSSRRFSPTYTFGGANLNL